MPRALSARVMFWLPITKATAPTPAELIGKPRMVRLVAAWMPEDVSTRGGSASNTLTMGSDPAGTMPDTPEPATMAMPGFVAVADTPIWAPG